MPHESEQISRSLYEALTPAAGVTTFSVLGRDWGGRPRLLLRIDHP